MPERGTIVAVRPGEVDISLAPGDACASCGACSPTGGAMLLERVPVRDGFHVGDAIEIETPAAERARARTLVFVVPVLALLAGYMAGFLLSSVVPVDRDTLGAAAALTCGAGAMFAVVRLDSKAAGDRRANVQVRAIIAQAKGPHHGVGPGNNAPLSEEDQTRE